MGLKKSQFLAGQITDSVMDILFLLIFNRINLPKTLQLKFEVVILGFAI